MRNAEVLGNPGLILGTGREVRQTVELEARLTGEAREGEGAGTANVMIIKDFERTDAEPKVIDVSPNSGKSNSRGSRHDCYT